MKRSRVVLFVVLVTLQVILVGSMVLSRETVLESGERVTLATAPVDPRDLFRGDYVVLRYQISTLDREAVPWNAPEPHAGQTVWVELDDSDRIATPTAVYGSPLVPPRVAIRGTVERVGGSLVTVDYAIAQYFVPEGTGWQVERARTVDVVVAVSNEGHGVIDHLILDGEPWTSPGT